MGNFTARLRGELKRIAWSPLCFDCAAIAAGLGAALLWGPLPSTGWPAAALVAAALASQAGVGLLLGVYRGRAARASFDEFVLLVATVSLTIIGITALASAEEDTASAVRLALIGGPLALAMMMAARMASRLRLERQLRSRQGSGRRTIVFGAGEGGYRAVRAMLREPDSPFLPVALLDDDPGKRHLRLMGVQVMGGRDREVPNGHRVQSPVRGVGTAEMLGSELRDA